MAVEFFIADYENAEHAKQVVYLLNSYAEDPMGGAQPLSSFAKDNLIDALHKTPGAFSVLGRMDSQPIALANCFTSLSTFACKPLINIHDLVVHADARGKGVSQSLLSFIEKHAVANRCCKVTLEVLEGNQTARAAYAKFGFDAFSLDDATGTAIFLQKKL